MIIYLLKMASNEYELIIVGSGPAGLSAALTAAYFKLKTIVLESGAVGGALTNTYPWKEVYCYLGFKGFKAEEISKKMAEHVRSEGVEIHENEEVKNLTKKKKIIVETTAATYEADAVILATGLSVPRRLGIPGEEHSCVYHHLSAPERFRKKKVLVVGGGDTAVERALALQLNGAETILIHRRDTLRASDDNIIKIKRSDVKIIWNTELKEIKEDSKNNLVAILLNRDTDKLSEIIADSIFIAVGTTSNKDFFNRINVKLDEKNHVIIDDYGRTNLEGVFAAGDVVGKWLRIPQAIGEGGYAALNAYKYIRNPYWA